MKWVKITASEQELEEFCYKPLISGGIYKSIYTEGGGNQYYDVFIDEGHVIPGVYKGRLRELDLSELRENRLNELGIC